MRQAGRTLPEYRVIREKYSFLERMKTPDLAAEITLQPIRRFGMDAAVIFSDILIIPEAMGQTLDFTPAPKLSPTLPGDLELKTVEPERDFAWLGETIGRVREALGEDQAVLGFCGAPWTLGCYMVERGAKKDFPGIKRWMYREPAAFGELMGKLCQSIVSTLLFQLRSGADAVQLFDTWAGDLAPEDYRQFVAPHVQGIIREVQAEGGKIIYYLRNGAHLVDQAIAMGADGLSVDWRTDLVDLARRLDAELGPGRCAVQGNLDPVSLFAHPDRIRAQVRELHRAMNGRPGHVFNLGHGLLPDIPIEGIEAFVSAVKGLA
jgi:uroporphyrinogen decarboxylase